MKLSAFRSPWMAAALAVLAIGAAPLPAKIDLSTLPERGDVELTIYNSEDLTLVRETRAMAFKDGENSLQFSWANTLIDPTSVHLQLMEGADFLEIEDISYPANTNNTLVWTINAAEAGEGVIEISYFTSGITWEADYVAKANRAENQMSLEGYVRVTNRSGEDYMNAKTRLLVGQINLVEPIAQLAASGRPQVGQKEQAQRRMRDVVVSEERAFAGRAAAADYRAQPKDVAKEGVSEYFLFTIEGREDLQDGLSKRLPSFGAKEVPFILTYKHNQRRWGSGIVKFYQLQNDKESKLGDSPLPDGFYQVFREAAGGGLAYVGRHNDKYIPIGEDLEMNLGSDGLLLLEKVRRRYKRINIEYSSYGDVQGWDDAEEWEVVVRNSKREPVPVEIVLQFSGDFDFKPVPATASKWTKNSATEQELRESIPPMSEKRFAYTLVTRQGTNAKK